jgi:hypothetical protein
METTPELDWERARQVTDTRLFAHSGKTPHRHRGSCFRRILVGEELRRNCRYSFSERELHQ